MGRSGRERATLTTKRRQSLDVCILHGPNTLWQASSKCRSFLSLSLDISLCAVSLLHAISWMWVTIFLPVCSCAHIPSDLAVYLCFLLAITLLGSTHSIHGSHNVSSRVLNYRWLKQFKILPHSCLPSFTAYLTKQLIGMSERKNTQISSSVTIPDVFSLSSNFGEQQFLQNHYLQQILMSWNFGQCPFMVWMMYM